MFDFLLINFISIFNNILFCISHVGIHLVPMAHERTWERKGSKDIKVVGLEDKRHVTVCVSSTSDGVLLPMQVIFMDKTKHSLPTTFDAKLCLDHGFHFTMTCNHWSNLKTCKEFVQNILIPYYMDVVVRMDLSKDQKMIWIIDCWFVHKSKAFLLWMKEQFPLICILFVPTLCTSKLQPIDVILQGPLKCELLTRFKKRLASCIQEQLEARALETKLDLSISTLRNLVCVWFFEAWKVIRSCSNMIRKGWEKCGLLRAFEKSFQASAMEKNTKCFFFAEKASDTIGSEELVEDKAYDDLKDLFDVEVMDMMAKCLDSDI